jgi:hypothetical protein
LVKEPTECESGPFSRGIKNKIKVNKIELNQSELN